MWSKIHWKEKMDRAVERAAHILKVNGVHHFGGFCLICEDEWFYPQHLLGPKHFKRLLDRIPENMPVQTEDFWQTWTLTTCILKFNHFTGTFLMMRQPDGNEPVAPAVAGFSLQPTESSDDPYQRVLAAVRMVPPPPPVQNSHYTSPQQATSSTFAPPAVDIQLASQQQQQSATAGITRDTIGTQQPPVSGGGVTVAVVWCWQQNAAREVTRLEEILVAALGSTMDRYCELCQCSIVGPSESFVKHVSTDRGHMALVQARFEHEGPSWRGWVQCWGCVAEFNHLTLNVSTGELRARG
jgi:hypothetical protein